MNWDRLEGEAGGGRMEAPTAQWVTAPSQAIPTTNRPGPLGAHSLRPPPPIGSSGTSVRPETRDERRETRDERPTGNSLGQGPNLKESLTQTSGLTKTICKSFRVLGESVYFCITKLLILNVAVFLLLTCTVL